MKKFKIDDIWHKTCGKCKRLKPGALKFFSKGSNWCKDCKDKTVKGQKYVVIAKYFKVLVTPNKTYGFRTGQELIDGCSLNIRGICYHCTKKFKPRGNNHIFCEKCYKISKKRKHASYMRRYRLKKTKDSMIKGLSIGDYQRLIELNNVRLKWMEKNHIIVPNYIELHKKLKLLLAMLQVELTQLLNSPCKTCFYFENFKCLKENDSNNCKEYKLSKKKMASNSSWEIPEDTEEDGENF